MIKKVLFITAMAFIATFSVNAQNEMDMGGAPPKVKKKTKKEITSPDKHKYTEVQKKYQNQIVFSKSEIKRDQEDASAFVKTWELGEPLYFRVYHSQTLIESEYDYHEKQSREFNEYGYAYFSEQTVVFINGKEMADFEVASGDKEYVTNWVTSSGTVYDSSQEEKTSGSISNVLARAFHALGNDFKEGSYDIEIKVYAMPSVLGGNVERSKDERHALMYSGKIKINVTKEGMNKFAPYLCRNILKKSGQMIDPAIEIQIAESFGRSYGYKALSANIIDSDWSIKRNEFGVVLFRFITSEVAYIDKDGKTEIMEITVKQDHDGSKFQNSVSPYTLTYDRPYCAFCTDYKKTIK